MLNVVGEWQIHMVHIQEVRGLNLSLKTSYTEISHCVLQFLLKNAETMT